jgi:menaquinone-9 beta-reductase
MDVKPGSAGTFDGPTYDVAVVGLGPAGAVSATLLARAGWRVVAVDRAIFPRDKPCAEYLSPAAEPLLRDLGVLGEILAANPSRLRGFRIFAPNGRMFQGDFAATRNSAGESLFETGLAVPRLLLDPALVESARRAGAEVREGWRVAGVERRDESDGWLLARAPAGESTDGLRGAVIRSRLLIAADGIHSTVVRRLGLQVPGHLRKVALVAHMRGIAGLGPYGEMHVAGRRYVGVAPLEPASAGDLCNVAMVVDEARERDALAGRAEPFVLEALHTFPCLRGRLEAAQIVQHTLTTSRMHAHARQLSGASLLLIGDAAGYYDPFTGEGIYRALSSARLAAGVADEALRAGDLSATALARYDRLYAAEVRGRHLVEQLIQIGVRVPPLMNHFARVLSRRKSMADAIVAVTGDYLPASAILRAGFLLRLVL